MCFLSFQFQILLSFVLFDLERKNDCESNFIDVFGEITDIPSRYVHIRYVYIFLTSQLTRSDLILRFGESI